MKYQSSSAQCLKVSSKVKISDRYTECQEDGMSERRTSVNTDSYSILKKKKTTKLILPIFFRKHHKNNTFILVQKYPKAVGG